jgi:putative tryptophan/tyrosine transport system substrate-binding protein
MSMQGSALRRTEIARWCSTAGIILLLACSILAAPCVAEAQQPTKKVPRIGVLSPQKSTELPTVQREPFARGLRALGWTLGVDILIEPRSAEGEVDRLPALAAELVQLPVDVIVARGNAAIRAAQHATRTIPIVMAVSADPVAQGFVASLARPGGNLTGLSTMQADLVGKQLEMLHETVPTVSRLAVLANSTNPATLPYLRALQSAAQRLGVQLQVLEVQRQEDVAPALAAIAREAVGAFLVLTDPVVLGEARPAITAFALQQRLPAMYPWRVDTEAGGLMSYGPSGPDLHTRAAYYVDRLLKGAKPADLPVEQPIKFELVINLKTAQALGLTIPSTLLFQADEVLQ